VQQSLGRHAADVQAGAAEGGATFDAGGLEAQLAGANGGVVATGTPTEDDDVVAAHGCSPAIGKEGFKGSRAKNYDRNMGVRRAGGQGEEFIFAVGAAG
jgi:hypothetical protein